MEKWKSGEQNLPDLEAWVVVYPLIYEQWLMENDAEKQKWLEKNDAVLEEFEGRKFLVECDEATSFRDYDKNNHPRKDRTSIF